jgi:hypothetical protein
MAIFIWYSIQNHHEKYPAFRPWHLPCGASRMASVLTVRIIATFYARQQKGGQPPAPSTCNPACALRESSVPARWRACQKNILYTELAGALSDAGPLASAALSSDAALSATVPLSGEWAAQSGVMEQRTASRLKFKPMEMLLFL